MPSWADHITPHQCLTHTTGLINFTNILLGSLKTKSLERLTPPKIVSLFKHEEPEFSPGERDKFSYNNSGYYLIGELVRSLTGESLWSYSDRVFFNL